MFLHALATAVPPTHFTQSECWDILDRSKARATLSRRALLTLHAILKRDSGIATRHFALPEIETVFGYNNDQLNDYFRREAPRLAGTALTTALARAGVAARELDALLVCTCTGYLCPGISGYVMEAQDLRPDVYLQDLVGLGCGAAIPTLRAADALLARQPDAVIATIAVEVCSAAFYLDDDPGVLVSACLFGDGAAAAIWRSTPGPSELQCRNFSTLHLPADRDKLRFEQRDGRLRNLLHATVPQLAAGAVGQLLATEQARPESRAIARVIAHPGGRDVIDALEQALPGFSLAASRAVLRSCGNMSSPSVLFVLEEALRHGTPGADEDWWLTSFGAGFSAHACRIGLST